MCGSIPQISISADVAVASQIRLSGSSGLLNAPKEVEMDTQTFRSTDKVKTVRSSVRRQLAVSLAAAATVVLIFGQGGPSAKAG